MAQRTNNNAWLRHSMDVSSGWWTKGDNWEDSRIQTIIQSRLHWSRALESQTGRGGRALLTAP